MANLTETKAQYATLGMGVINVLMTVISLVLVEKCGRRSLLLVGFIGMCIDSVLLTFALRYAVSSLPHKIYFLFFLYIYCDYFYRAKNKCG